MILPQTEARKALKAELVPSKPVDMPADQFAREMTEQLRTALRDKDDWYTRLIRYKPIDLVDESFWDDLIYVLTEWAQKQTLGPAKPWALTASLNEIFQGHQIKAKAQVLPAPLDKLSTSVGRVRKVKQIVAVVVGEGFTPVQVDLRHFHGTGWYDLLGLGSPEKSARSIVQHVVELT